MLISYFLPIKFTFYKRPGSLCLLLFFLRTELHEEFFAKYHSRLQRNRSWRILRWTWNVMRNSNRTERISNKTNSSANRNSKSFKKQSKKWHYFPMRKLSLGKRKHRYDYHIEFALSLKNWFVDLNLKH